VFVAERERIFYDIQHSQQKERVESNGGREKGRERGRERSATSNPFLRKIKTQFVGIKF
jgi:hypothetical protein